MAIEFDPAKNRKNLEVHGIGLADFAGFDSDPVVLEDTRYDYGETRYRAFGRIGGVGHCLAYTLRGDNLRLISFRRARAKEMRRYGR
jgi:uncharacterized DUF497 family protein